MTQSILANTQKPSRFLGAKLFLFLGSDLVVIKRDDKPEIPFPGYWDLPGGGREPGETPQQCVLRETREEVGVKLDPQHLVWARFYGRSWMFAGHLPLARRGELQLGDEGQELRLMSVEAYLEHPKAVPQFVSRLQHYLGVLRGCP